MGEAHNQPAGAKSKPPAVAQTPSWKVNKFGKVDPTPWQPDPDVTAYVNELRDIQPLKAGDAGAEDIWLAEKVGVLIYPLKTYMHRRESKNSWLFVRTSGP